MRGVTIRTKLIGLVALFAVGGAGVMLMVYARTSDKLETSDYRDVVAMKDLIADALPPPIYAIEPMLLAHQAVAAMDKNAVPQLRTRWKQLENEFAGRQRLWTEQLQGSFRNAVVDSGALARRIYDLGNEQLIPALAGDDRAKAVAALAAMNDLYAQHRARIDEVVKLANQQADTNIATAASTISSRKLQFLLGGLLVIVIGGVAAFVIVRDLGRRMQATTSLLHAVAGGDLTQRLDVAASDEIGQMAASLNAMLDAIEEALSEAQHVSETVAGAANALSGQSEQISSGAQEQASSLEETAASLEEITATVKQSSGSAQQASQLAMSSREVAQNGGSVVQEAVAAMNEITRASQKIGDIITTIDEIALQTNLLALNAAVEAARAGEQGRGFAVVASEVGSLAQRSAGAAKEVKILIQDTLSRVGTGQKLVDQSGRTLQDIIVSVKKVTDIVGDIAAASREQSAGVEQVNQAVSQMDQVTQNNANQTEELARTAESLSENAAQLRALVSKFRLTSTRGREASTSSGNPKTSPRNGRRSPGRGNGPGARAERRTGEARTERRSAPVEAADDWELASGSTGGDDHEANLSSGSSPADDKQFEMV